MVDCVCDGRCNGDHHELAQAACAVWRVTLRRLDNDLVHLVRYLLGPEDPLVGEVWVQHPALLIEQHLLEQRYALSHDEAAVDLSLHQERVDRLSNIHRLNYVHELDLARQRIDLDLHAAGSECVENRWNSLPRVWVEVCCQGGHESASAYDRSAYRIPARVRVTE